MPRPDYITVTAPPGRATPIHKDDGVDLLGGQLQVTEADVCRVRYSQTVQRSINRGDLITCTSDGAHCILAQASAPRDLGVGAKVTRVQRKEGKSS